MTDDDVLLDARARILADLQARQLATSETVSTLEEALSQRRWWIQQWPEGRTYVAGLVAQDVQDALLESIGRWPVCRTCEQSETSGDHQLGVGPTQHALHISPDLGGPDPVWVCEESGTLVAPLGGLSAQRA